MIEIINQYGQILELSAGTTIPVERNNSLFNAPDKFIQDITYPGKAGLTENNKIFIQNGHLVEAVNAVYELDVKVIISGSPFFAGIFAYKIISNEINFTLKVNFASVADIVKNTSIRSIITYDTVSDIANDAALEDLMKETCETPLDYPFVFFPIKNEKHTDTDLPIHYPWINYWDHAAQEFKVNMSAVPGDNVDVPQVPFFRASYILRKVLECLKFTVSGGYFTEPSEQEIYFYSRLGLRSNYIQPSLFYMPDKKITDYLKEMADRTKISIEFDVLDNSVYVETPASVLNSTEILDITDYIETIQEIATSESKGYELTLKLDNTDDAWNTGNDDEKIFTPPTKLHIGQSETKVEMKIGTLNKFDDENYSYPINKQNIDSTDLNLITEWQLSLLQYSGMKDLGGGIVFPEGKPYDLSLKDAEWYRFLNDSKPLIIVANIPPAELSKLKATRKIGCVSNEGFYFTALPSKIRYTLTNNDAELIKVSIEARQLISRYDTPAFIEVIVPEQAGKRLIQKYKAYYSPHIHGFNEVKVERHPLPGSTATFGFELITSPTNDMGLGGAIGMTYGVTGTRTDMENSENRVYASPFSPPRYYVQSGFIGYFTQVGDYYTFDDIPEVQRTDNKPIWIVF
jgi:hypothetical protein